MKYVDDDDVYPGLGAYVNACVYYDYDVIHLAAYYWLQHWLLIRQMLLDEGQHSSLVICLSWYDDGVSVRCA